MRWFDGLAAVAIAGMAAFLVAQPPLRALEGPAYDLLLRARQEIYSPLARAQFLQGVPALLPELPAQDAELLWAKAPPAPRRKRFQIELEPSCSPHLSRRA